MTLTSGIVFYTLTLWAPVTDNNNGNRYLYSKSSTTGLPFFMEKLILDIDLKGKSDWELDIMRNEIFARHGRRFNRADLQNYFYKQNWYVPKFTAEDFPHLILTQLQKRNATFILDYQQNSI